MSAFRFFSAFTVLNWGKALSLLLVSALWFALPVQAQESGADTNQTSVLETLEPVLDTARESGATIVVIDPSEKAATETEAGFDIGGFITDILLPARAALVHIFSKTPDYPSEIITTLQKLGPEGGLYWLLYAVLAIAIAFVVGRYVQAKCDQWGRRTFAGLYNPNPATRADKIAYLLSRTVLMGINTFGFLFAAGLVMLIADWGHPPSRTTMVVALLTFVGFRLGRIIFLNVLAPDAPSHRMIAMDDHSASALYRDQIRVLAVSALAIGICVWMGFLGLDELAHALTLIIAIVLTTFGLSWIAWRHREPIRQAIYGGKPESQVWLPVRLLGRFWESLAIVYFISAGAASIVRLVLELPNAFGLVTAPVDGIFLALGLYAVLLLIIDRVYASRMAQARELSSEPDEEMITEDGFSVEDEQEPQEPLFKEVFDHAAGVVAFACWAGYVALSWGVDLERSDSIFVRTFDIAIVLFLAHLAYRAVQTWIDRQIAEEDPVQPGMDMEEMMGQGASRLATLLPIFRNFLVVTIVAISGMIVLSEMGVDIGPLFAGAGVVGLAIGFGAQTLIRDVFSGFFFLLDDAFRKGEYIDLGGVKGTVEKISIRSFQLRHHNGPLHTIPFGEIKQLTNFSRDWVMMKLPLRVTYDTDVERVRKLIKKLGQQLLEDEAIGHMFMQPLKSQGVYKMEESAMILRVKFMTKPGDQFMVRKHVYAKIRELFEKEDIKFAHRQVTVRLASPDEEGDEPAQKQSPAGLAAGAALAGGVLPLLDDDITGMAKAGDGDEL
ncbi:mechanosensitive ion channel family protein [Coralliovum pocilloporae]|uniref:mechanosensitive ion channel family protein n=1 Tax=Coralliovum pocilloporae TaxID=3066369 RepID=UPI0033076EEE